MSYRCANMMILLGFAGAIPILLAVPWIHTQLGGFYPACMLESLLGRPCPMCGLTTALHSVLTRQPGALASHPLVPILVLVSLCEFVGRGAILLCRMSPAQTRQALRMDLALHGALFGAYLVYCVIFFARQG